MRPRRNGIEGPRRSPLKLSREEVNVKYAPIPDPAWTPEVEAEFFAKLPKATYRQAVRPSDEKEMLLRQFATSTLKAKRVNASYISTLGAIFGEFADADLIKAECRIPQRNKQLGTPDTIRTIQAQMLAAGLLVKEVRSQGRGFVGEVFVHRPRAAYRYRLATPEYLEELYRANEGECQAHPVPANISPEDFPY